MNSGFTFSKNFPESIRLKPLQSQEQSSYQNQQAFSYEASVSRHELVRYSKLQRQLAPKNYATRSFLGIQNDWIGKKVFLDGVQPAWPASQKQLEKKMFSTQSYEHPSQNFIGRAFETCAYPTKTFHLEAKVQGGLDRDIKKALQQKKSPGEVREMLENL